MFPLISITNYKYKNILFWLVSGPQPKGNIPKAFYSVIINIYLYVYKICIYKCMYLRVPSMVKVRTLHILLEDAHEVIITVKKRFTVSWTNALLLYTPTSERKFEPGCIDTYKCIYRNIHICRWNIIPTSKSNKSKNVG